LLVRRRVKTDAQGQIIHLGRASNFLCDRQVGDTVELSGPQDSALVLPKDPSINVVAVCGGTGLSPVRAMLQDRRTSQGVTMAFYGVNNPAAFICWEEMEEHALQDPDIKIFTAYSDPPPANPPQAPNNPGDTDPAALSGASDVTYRWGVFVQDVMYEQRHKLLQLLENPQTYFVFCGAKPMYQGVLKKLEKACQDTGRDWNQLLSRLQAEGRWRVEAG
jgi:benzoyl-CoA 2,3-dioxygenase component A